MTVGDQPPPGDFLEDFVDHLLPLLSPYQAKLYVFLLRHSHLKGSPTVRIGIRSIASGLGKGTRGPQSNYGHIREQLGELVLLGCIGSGDTDRLGTLYQVIQPLDVPAVREAIRAANLEDPGPDHYVDAERRRELFERDRWTCQYCGERVTLDTATLDHVVPVTNGGSNAPSNLTTACLMCNSIKSGRTYEEAAPLILEALRQRRSGP